MEYFLVIDRAICYDKPKGGIFMHAHLPHSHHDHSHTLLQHLPAVEDFAAIAELFRLLSDSSRLRLFWILCHGEECVANLAAMMEMSSPALSHHLRQLRDAGLVVSRRAGKEVHYRAAATPAVDLLHRMMEEMNHLVCPTATEKVPKIKRIQQVHDLLVSDLSQRHTIEALAKQFFIDSSTLKRQFSQVYGLPIAAYLKQQRTKKAAELLITTDLSVAAIAAQVGYETPSKFSAAFKETVGLSPLAYRKNRLLR
jgi:AraC-like DNA-binding protein